MMNTQHGCGILAVICSVTGLVKYLLKMTWAQPVQRPFIISTTNMKDL